MLALTSFPAPASRAWERGYACTLFINSLVHLQLTKTETARDSSDNETDYLVQLTSIMWLQIIPLYRSLFSWF